MAVSCLYDNARLCLDICSQISSFPIPTVLESCAKYFFEVDGGKKIRPAMILGVAYALNSQVNKQPRLDAAAVNEATDPLGPYGQGCSPAQKRMAEIAEMIHTASLFHDDVIDKASTRRNVSSVNQVFGNKLAILGGDFLLSRASVALARLRNFECVELISTVIEHLVKGEVMQMKPSEAGMSGLEYYLRKNYYKTASLMGNSSLAAAVLGGHSEEEQRCCYLYGTYVGQAFQLIDDALDFEGLQATIGKVYLFFSFSLSLFLSFSLSPCWGLSRMRTSILFPTALAASTLALPPPPAKTRPDRPLSIYGQAPLADLKSGLATAPTLFAAQEFPQLETLIHRKFEAPGDIDETLQLLARSQGLQRTKALAQVHCSLSPMPTPTRAHAHTRPRLSSRPSFLFLLPGTIFIGLHNSHFQRFRSLSFSFALPLTLTLCFLSVCPCPQPLSPFPFPPTTLFFAQVHAEKAIAAIRGLGPSPARDALVALACRVVMRTH
jgi:geranylgeranyl pyrophosphate synthase